MERASCPVGDSSGARYLTGNGRGCVLTPGVALGRASGESGCRGMRQGRSESLEVGKEWTGPVRRLEVPCGQTDMGLPPLSGTWLLE